MRRLAAALLLAAAAGVAIAADTPDPVAPVLAEARALVDAGKPAAAIEKLTALERADDPRVAHMLGVAAYHADDHQRAIELLTPVVAKLPPGSLERREAIQILGLSHYLEGHLPESVPLLEQTRAVTPDNIELNHTLGMAYVQTGQPAKARECFARVFHVAPESAAAHVLVAQMMIRVQLDDLAEDELKRAIEIDPRAPRAHLLLGQVSLFRGRFDEAADLTRREIELSPDDAMAHYQLGDALGRQQKWDEAVDALQKSLWINPYFSGPYILLGKGYMKKQQLATAEGMLRRAVNVDPKNKSAHYLLAQVLQQSGRTDEAKREFETAERLIEADR